MNPPPTKTSQNAANWMLGLGVFYSVVAMFLACVAVGFGGPVGFARLFALMIGGEVPPLSKPPGIKGLTTLIFGGGALVLMLATVACLVTQKFVRRGSRRARNCATLFSALVAAAPLPPVLLIWGGNSPNWSEIAEISFYVALWMLPEVWLFFLLLKAGREARLESSKDVIA